MSPVVARRALVRWSVRMVRREWRQQLLVLTLLTVAVAAAIGLASAAYNLAPVPGNAEFGTANHALSVEAPTTELVDADLAAAKAFFGVIDTIGHRDVAVPGRFEPVDHRDQDPAGPYGSPRLALREGRLPTAAGEAAVTDGLARELGLAVGAVSTMGDVRRTVVGIVENPSDLGDEFALVAASDPLPRESATVLVDATSDRVRSFRPPSGRLAISARSDISEGALAAIAVLAVAMVALLFVGLLAAAGFVVIAHRRRRQLGMLAAIGATERHVRVAMIANGAVLGALAATIGAVVGVVGWLVAEPRIERAAGYRLDRLAIPWWVVVAGMLLAVGAATGAAWWPARVASRSSIVEALSGRPPTPRPARRAAAAAAILSAAGLWCLAVAGPVDESQTTWSDTALLVGGTLLTVVGVMLLCPLALRVVGACARPLPIAGRVALRDLARHRSRSGAALAAIVMAMGIPAATVIAASAAEHGAEAGNLPVGQLLIRGDYDGPFVPRAVDLPALEAGVQPIATALGNARVIALEAAVNPTLEYEPTSDGRLAVTLVARVPEGWRDVSLLYVASAPLLAAYGLDADALDASTGVITTESGDLGILGAGRPEAAPAERRKVEPVAAATSASIEPRYSSIPGSFVTRDEVQRRGWEVVSSGRWLVQTDDPPSDEQLAAARHVASQHGLTIEVRDDQAGLGRLRTGATVVGALVALGVLAMTVGLIRGEAASDLRTLASTGATSATRRGLTAVTAGALAALGATLGTAAAATVLRVGFLDDLGSLPVAHLLVIALGTPAAAAAAGWVAAGREPSMTSRQAIA